MIYSFFRKFVAISCCSGEKGNLKISKILCPFGTVDLKWTSSGYPTFQVYSDFLFSSQDKDGETLFL